MADEGKEFAGRPAPTGGKKGRNGGPPQGAIYDCFTLSLSLIHPGGFTPSGPA